MIAYKSLSFSFSQRKLMTLTKAARMKFKFLIRLHILHLLKIYIISYGSILYSCDSPLLYRESLQFPNPMPYVNDHIYLVSLRTYHYTLLYLNFYFYHLQYIMKSLLLLAVFLSFFFGSLFARHLPTPSHPSMCAPFSYS